MNKSTEYKLSNVRIKLVKEGRTLYSSEPLTSPEKAIDLMAKYLSQFDREVAAVIALDAKLRPICCNEISIGSLDATLIDLKSIFKFALLSNAASIMMLHNHPSGDTSPSQDDMDIAKRIYDAGELLTLPLVDFIVIGEDEILSFRQAGLMSANK